MNDDRLSRLLRSEVPDPGPDYWDSIDATLAEASTRTGMVGTTPDRAELRDASAARTETDPATKWAADHANGDVVGDVNGDVDELVVPIPIRADGPTGWHRRSGGRIIMAAAAVVVVAVGVGLLRNTDGTSLDVVAEPAGQGDDPGADVPRSTDGSDDPSPDDDGVVVVRPDDPETDVDGAGPQPHDPATEDLQSAGGESEGGESEGGESEGSGQDPVDTTGPGSGEVDPTPPTPPLPEPTVYEGFDFGLAAGADAVGAAGSGSGFAPGTTWSVISGSATVTFDERGLEYRDAAGNELAAAPGAVSIRPLEISPELVREYSSPLVTADGYWVGYLLRLDSAVAGDAFWTTDGSFDRGSAGLQSRAVLQVINGQRSTVVHESGATHFIVIRVMATGAEVWIDPDLDPAGGLPGPADLTDDRITLDSGLARFKFNTANDGAYTIDEFRIGDTFAQVAPTQGPVAPSPGASSGTATAPGG